MYILKGIIKVVINNKVIYCNNMNYNNIGTLSKNKIISPKASGNDINYTYVEIQEDNTHDE
ncbi:MAG: hypothetical protein MUO60_12325 [Clostridiaceae bacterium]|nr:hypothetical protein [Clostridiaceae bacterium]